jgi:invasion protein IalB
MWMKPWGIGLAAVLALGLQGAVWAQDNQAAEPAAEEPQAEAPQAAPGGDLAIADDTVGTPYVQMSEGTWELRCIRAPEGQEDPCQMYQLLMDENGAPIVEVSIFKLPEGGRAVAGATVIVPLETGLQQQLTIVIDGGQPRRYPFAFCSRVGCYARIGFTASDMVAFRAGREAVVSIVPALSPDQRVNLNMSLIGFTKIFNATPVAAQP